MSMGKALAHAHRLELLDGLGKTPQLNPRFLGEPYHVMRLTYCLLFVIMKTVLKQRLSNG